MNYPRSDTFRAVRIGNGPIIHPDMPGLEGEAGRNINGPSLVRAPEWLPDPLGRYYLYFAHHNGKYIRLATADRVEGPYTVYPPGTITTDQFEQVLRESDSPLNSVAHVASPDVHIDDERRELRMYFHAAGKGWGQQLGFRAHSTDGIHFAAHPEPLGSFYFRVFTYGEATYAIAKEANRGNACYRSPDGLNDFEEGPIFAPDMRHSAVWRDGDTLYLFHSDYRQIERILVSTIDLTRPWREWKHENTQLLLEPEHDYEGADLPLEPSKPGAAPGPVNQLRDPGIYEENGVLYLFYSVAGESGIALARIERID